MFSKASRIAFLVFFVLLDLALLALTILLFVAAPGSDDGYMERGNGSATLASLICYVLATVPALGLLVTHFRASSSGAARVVLYSFAMIDLAFLLALILGSVVIGGNPGFIHHSLTVRYDPANAVWAAVFISLTVTEIISTFVYMIEAHQKIRAARRELKLSSFVASDVGKTNVPEKS